MRDIIRRPQTQTAEFDTKEDNGGYRPPLKSVRSKKTIERWIMDRLSDPDKDGALTSLILEKVIGTNGTVLHSKNIGQNPVNAPDLGRMFYDIAQTDCQDLTGNHTYRLSAFYSNRNQPEAFYNFTLAGQQDPEFMSSESPTREGFLTHGLNYATRTMNKALEQMTISAEINNETMRIQQTMNSRLMVENHSAYEMMKDLLLERAMRENAQKFEEIKYARSSAERKEWLGMLMPVVNRVTGREVFPYNSEDSAIMKQIANLSEEKLMQLAGVLQDNPKLLALVAARLEQLVEGEGKTPKQREERLASKTDPESDFERALPPKGDENKETDSDGS
jgi:hypothetical protein